MAYFKILSWHFPETSQKESQNLRTVDDAGTTLTCCPSDINETVSRLANLPGIKLCSFLRCINTDIYPGQRFQDGCYDAADQYTGTTRNTRVGEVFSPSLPIMQQTMKFVLVLDSERFLRIGLY
jgi:hypothetical protein